MFKHKDYVLTILETGSFTKASEKLFVSQPSLSATIKRLEDKLGAPLFDRSNSPIKLTEVGEEYIRQAKEIIKIEQSFSKYLTDRGNLISGKLKIGGSTFFSSFILPEMVSKFCEKYSGVELEIFEDTTKNLINKLKDGDLDIIMDNAVIDDEKISSEVFVKERLVLAVPKEYEINQKLKKYALTAEQIINDEHVKKESVDLSKFKKQPFILLRHENDTGKRAEKMLKKYQVEPTVAFCIDQQITAYNLACTGMGISFIGDELIKKVPPTERLCYYAINDRLSFREIYFYYKKSGYLTVALKKFIEFNVKE